MKLRGGEVIALSSDLGGGKTAFVRGLVRGMGSTDHVSSPTFTIGKKYGSPAKDLTVYHYDFYRLSEPGLMAIELAESLEDSAAVIAVEWGGIVEGVLPSKRLTIRIKTVGENDRELVFEAPTDLSYLLEAIQS